VAEGAGPALVVGLGNPGAAYAGHRHNLGAEVVERLASRLGERLRSARGVRARVAEARLDGRRVVLAVPETYMNDSGLAVGPLVRRFHVEDLSRLVVVHDELDLPVGRVKVKLGGGTAGHNGLRSIVAHLHDPGFVRVRVGIGRPPGQKDATSYVLSAPSRREREELDVAVEEAADAVEAVVVEGAEAAMNRFNAGPA
jgi:PTH1 family peptidyl-tRNA hydrolase